MTEMHEHEKVNLGEAVQALRQFVDTVNATGGLVVNDAGETVPAADEDWLDLAEAYLAACAALGVEPLNVEVEHFAEMDEEADGGQET